MELQNKKIFDKFFIKILLITIEIEFLSFCAFLYPEFGNFIFAIVAFTATYLIVKDLKYGIYLFLLELIIGGQGYLFSYQLASFKISIRLTIFLLIFLVGIIRILKNKNFSFLKNNYFYLLLSLFTFISIGLLTALWYHRPLSSIFFDINGYLFFALIIVFLSTKLEGIKNLKQNKLVQIILAATTWVSVKTIITLALFSYGLSQVGDSLVYKWIRDTRVGEITKMTYPLYRIFFQSHIYNLIAILLILTIIFLYNKRKLKQDYIQLFIILFLNFSAIIISQSRSLWLSGSFGILILFLALIFIFKINWKKIILFLFVLLALWFTNNLFLNLSLRSKFDILQSRLEQSDNNSSAVSSRREQIAPLLAEIRKAPLLGNGFAKTISYRSDDPRIKNIDNPEGLYTTYSFELGYLDIILKIGFLGFLTYLILLFYLITKLFPLIKKRKWLFGIILGVIVVTITDAFTPYLNHPLGIGFFLMAILIYENNKSNKLLFKK